MLVRGSNRRGKGAGKTPTLWMPAFSDGAGISHKNAQILCFFVANSLIGSKHELHRELELSRGSVRLSNHARRGAVSIAIENNLIRVREIRVIEKIKHLRPEL